MGFESRKFIDLIRTVTSRWANWEPPTAINVGDYGLINKDTGEFEWEGNLYTTKNSIGIDMTDEALRPVETEGEDKYIAKSWGVTAKKVDTAAEAEVPGIVNVALKVQFQFSGKKRAAALVMYKPRYITLPKDERITKLLKSKHNVFEGKYVVTEVICCAAYVMYMSSNIPETFSVSLQATGPIVPVVNAGGAASFTWSSEISHGTYREGSESTAKYMPLYRLKKPRPSFWRLLGERGEEQIDHSIEKWEDVDPPWNTLDEEGEEEEICDVGMNGEFDFLDDGYPDDDDDL